jgi:hypothetical protein
MDNNCEHDWVSFLRKNLENKMNKSWRNVVIFTFFSNIWIKIWIHSIFPFKKHIFASCSKLFLASYLSTNHLFTLILYIDFFSKLLLLFFFFTWRSFISSHLFSILSWISLRLISILIINQILIKYEV